MAVFDAHLHVVDPRFPLVANDGFVPAPFSVDDYRARVAGLDVRGGAVVAGSFHGTDPRWLLDALARLGEGFVGVAQLPADAGDEEILALDRAGVRALRFTLRRGGRLDERLARRAWELAGWHTELYVDARELPDVALPAVIVDHLGLSRAGLPALLAAVERGWRVKATGFSRGDLDVPAALRAIAAVDPGALLFGTDLPGTRAPEPFRDADLDLVRDIAGERALWDNAAAVYRVGS